MAELKLICRRLESGRWTVVHVDDGQEVMDMFTTPEAFVDFIRKIAIRGEA